MTPSLIGANTDHGQIGDNAVDHQCCSQHIKESNMKTCYKKTSDYNTDSEFITIQYDTKKGLRGKSEFIEIAKKN